MSTPSWWEELIGSSEILATVDRVAVREWQGNPGSVDEGAAQIDPDDVPPLTVRLGNLATALAEQSEGFTLQQRVDLLGVLESVLVSGAEYDQTAVVTGFFETLLAQSDEGLDLRPIWDEMGPKARDVCVSLNEFWGVEMPSWMRKP
ncbi:hypothetical protein [Streptomyces abikoensis]|uniref:hypothetical protein n=1 Tax=Streptomyces abikoensis TaxID=97398 RepID=UPI0016741920|nr:hypothetical protein [Streptomyces abikoensis]GGP54714.1 hypothetical protein GCM10010214_29760 [Streptomyces abikoensis]